VKKEDKKEEIKPSKVKEVKATIKNLRLL